MTNIGLTTPLSKNKPNLQKHKTKDQIIFIKVAYLK